MTTPRHTDPLTLVIPITLGLLSTSAPGRQTIGALCTTRSVWDLHPLPQELIEKIGKELGKRDIQAVRMASKRLSRSFAPMASESFDFSGSQRQVSRGLGLFTAHQELTARAYIKSILFYTHPIAVVDFEESAPSKHKESFARPLVHRLW